MTNNIGERIKEARNKRGLTQWEMAVKLSISQGFLSHVEKGRNNPTTELVNSIANILGIDIGWLLTGSGDMEPSKGITELETLDQDLAKAVIAERQDRYGSTEPMTLTTTEAEIIELLRDLPEDARFDEYDNIRALWLSLCRGKNPPV